MLIVIYHPYMHIRCFDFSFEHLTCKACLEYASVTILWNNFVVSLLFLYLLHGYKLSMLWKVSIVLKASPLLRYRIDLILTKYTLIFVLNYASIYLCVYPSFGPSSYHMSLGASLDTSR